MNRTIAYRGYEICVELTPTSKDMFDVTFRVAGLAGPMGRLGIGKPTQIPNGPFSRRWAYLVAEIAGQVAIDVILGLPDASVRSVPAISDGGPQRSAPDAV